MTGKHSRLCSRFQAIFLESVSTTLRRHRQIIHASVRRHRTRAGNKTCIAHCCCCCWWCCCCWCCWWCCWWPYGAASPSLHLASEQHSGCSTSAQRCWKRGVKKREKGKKTKQKQNKNKNKKPKNPGACFLYVRDARSSEPTLTL